MKKNNVHLICILLASSFLFSCCSDEQIQETNQEVGKLTALETLASTRISLSNYTINKGVLSGISDNAIVNGKLVVPDNVTLIANDDNGSAVSIFSNNQKQLLKELVVGDSKSGSNVIIGEYSLDGCTNLHKITIGSNVKEVSGFVIHENFNLKTIVWKKTSIDGIDFWNFPFGLDIKDYQENGTITPNTSKIDVIVPKGLLSNFDSWQGEFKSIKESLY